MSFAPKERAEEREAKAAAAWIKAKQSLKTSGAGCLFLALLVAFFCVYCAGYVAALY